MAFAIRDNSPCVCRIRYEGAPIKKSSIGIFIMNDSYNMICTTGTKNKTQHYKRKKTTAKHDNINHIINLRSSALYYTRLRDTFLKN